MFVYKLTFYNLERCLTPPPQIFVRQKYVTSVLVMTVYTLHPFLLILFKAILNFTQPVFPIPLTATLPLTFLAFNFVLSVKIKVAFVSRLDKSLYPFKKKK